MSSTKQLFLNAARNGQAVFIPIHVEISLMKHGFLKRQWKPITEVRRAGELSIEIADALKGKVPALITTQTSKPLIKPGKQDILARDPHPSAIKNPKHSKFLQDNKTSIALVSGASVGLCIDWTLAACLNRGIQPIVVLDATNASVDEPRMNNDNAALFLEIAREQDWLPKCLTASTDDVIGWAKEL